MVILILEIHAFGEKIVGTNNLLLSSSSTLSLYHLHLIFIGILLTFSPMHFLGFNVMPRRILDPPATTGLSLHFTPSPNKFFVHFLSSTTT